MVCRIHSRSDKFRCRFSMHVTKILLQNEFSLYSKEHVTGIDRLN